MTTLAPKLPWSHAYAGGFPRMGGQSLPTDADAQDYLDRVKAADGGVGVEVGVAQAIDVFVRGCKNDSANYAGDPTRTNWDALKACCVMAGARTISGALVPLKGTAPTAQGGWTASDYSRGGTTPGLKGNGSTLYLDTNRANNADGQDDAHHAVYATDGGTSLHYKIGSYSASSGVFAAQRTAFSSGANRPSVYLNVTASGTYNSTTTNGNAAGFYGASRKDSTEFSYAVPGASGTHTAASAAPNNLNQYVFGLNSTGTLAGQFEGRLSFYSIGSALDLAALDSRTTHLMNSIRFTLLTGLNPGDYDPATLAYLLAAYTAGGSLA